MTVPSGYLPSSEGMGNIQNLLLGIANLQERRRNNEILRTYRDAERLKVEQEVRKAQDAERETNIQRSAAALFGDKYDPEMEPALAPARAALATTAPMTFPAKDTAPGLGVPNLVNRPATVSDVGTLAAPGAEAIRGTSLAKLESLGYKKDDPRYQYYAKTAQIPLPGKVIAESETGSKAIQERVKAEIATETQPDETMRLRSVASKEDALRRQAEAKATVDEASVPYAKANAFNDARIKELEVQAKEFDRTLQPDKAAKLREEVKKLQGENVKINNENFRFSKTVELTNAYNSTNDPVQKEKILRAISLLHGHSGELLANDLAKQKEYVDAIGKAEQLHLDGVKYLKQYPDAANRAFATANQMRVKASQLAGEGTTQITSVSQVPNWHSVVGMGSPSPTYGTVVMPTDKAADFVSGKLSAIASGLVNEPTGKTRTLPDGRVVPEMKNRAEALAWHVYASNPAYATDPAALSHFIGEFNADQMTKDKALSFVQEIVQKNKEVAPPGTEGAKLKPAATGTELPTAVGATKVGTSKGEQTLADIEKKDAEAAQRRERRLAIDRERALYVSKKAQEAGVTAIQATPAQIRKWQEEFDRANVQRAREDVAITGAEVAESNRAVLKARGQ